MVPTPIKTICPACQVKLKASASHVGRRVNCPQCKRPFVIEAMGASESGIDATFHFDPALSNSDTSKVTETLHPVSGTEAAQLPMQFGKYQLLKVLGQGAMGTVYLAEDQELQRKVAIKVPTVDTNQSEEVYNRFRREARAVAALQHANICPIYEVAENDGVLYLAMAYVKGKPLTDATNPDELLPVKSALLVVRKIALALQVAHQVGVIHRDLKPDNVIVNLEGEPQVMDFGLAFRQDTEDTVLTAAGHLLGSPAYMSPEQASGKTEHMGPNCDIWSLGVILYELLTGRRPFEGNSVISMLKAIAVEDPPPPSTLRSGLDQRLDALCLKALEKDIDRRYQSMREYAVALADYITGKRVIRGVPEAPPREGPASFSGLALLRADSETPIVQPPTEEDSADEYHLAETDLVRCTHCGGPLGEDGGCSKCLAESQKIVVSHENHSQHVEADALTSSTHSNRSRKITWAEWLGLEARHEGELPIQVYVAALLVIMLAIGGGVLLTQPAYVAWWSGMVVTSIASVGLCGSYLWIGQELNVGVLALLMAPLLAAFNMIRFKPTANSDLTSVQLGKWCFIFAALGVMLMLLSLIIR